MYILTISPKAFLQLEDDNIKIIKDYKQASTFEKIGDAMRAAAKLNEDFESPIVQVILLGGK